MPDQRVVHITLEKCGSQWVKDVLTRREILAHSGLMYSNITGSISSRSELDIPSNTFSGPIYNMNQWEWRYWRRPGDKALVVLRDPRDILVSVMFAWLYSHHIDGNIRIVRRILAELPNDGDRLTYVMGAIGPCQRTIRSWTADLDVTSLLIRYETLVEDPLDGFRRVVDWLGWEVGQDVLQAAIDTLSFAARAGRQRGEEDLFSHHRRGLPGDWRNYFTREHGSLWEDLYPGLLTAASYEDDDNWWRDLPVAVRREPRAPCDHMSALADALQSRNSYLEREINDKERVIRELAAACDERLAAVEEKERMIHELAAECAERLAIIEANARPALNGGSGNKLVQRDTRLPLAMRV